MKNVVINCGDRHWQYHSVYKNVVHEFSSGPTCDEHSIKGKFDQYPPDAADFPSIQQLYKYFGGGFLTSEFNPDGHISFVFYNEKGKEIYKYIFKS